MSEYLISVPEMKKAPTEQLAKTMTKMSAVLLDRYINSPTFDLDKMMREALGDDSYDNPEMLTGPFSLGNVLIGLPSVMPKKHRGVSKGYSVVPVVQLPGHQPYPAFSEDGETFVDSLSVNLRGGRSINVHRVIPGMIVSLHHFNDSNLSDFREREVIYVYRVHYGWGDKGLTFEEIDEKDAIINTPAH